MAIYKAFIEIDLKGETFLTPIVADLKTAKALAQVSADKFRSRELHLKQRPLEWVRSHSDRLIRWTGLIDNEAVVVIDSI